MNKTLKSVGITILGGLIGFIFGYAVVLFTLLMIFGSKVEITSIIFLDIFFGIIYGLALGNLYSYYPKYVNKFCIVFALIGMLAASISGMFLPNIKAVFIIGFPILFSLFGVFFDKKKYKK